MNILSYMRNNGVKNFLRVIYQYKIQRLFDLIVIPINRFRKLKDIIVIECHTDFENNGGAFYDYLVANKYNEKYRIILLLKNKLTRSLPYNVHFFYLRKPSLKKSYYLSLSKIFTFDNDILKKYRRDQVFMYLTHGGFGLKNTQGKINVPSDVDFVLSPSEAVDPIVIKQFGLSSVDKLIHIGFPYQDVLYSNNNQRLLYPEYSKIVIWAPTFRKGGGVDRNDSSIETPFGIPLIENIVQLESINNYLSVRNIGVLIKLHPMQDLSGIELLQLSHIRFLTTKELSNKKITIYQLLLDSDALISDYSAVVFDYLHLNKPIGYVFSDIDSYKLGLSVNNLDEYIAGDVIMTIGELEHFFDNVINQKDCYHKEREQLLYKIFERRDGDSCERLVNFLGL